MEQLNFETLFNEVATPEPGSEPILNADELAGELLELIRDAKLAGLSGYELVEKAILEYEAERKAANPVEVAVETPDLNEGVIPPPAPVEEEEQDETLAEYEERIAAAIAEDNGFPPDHVVSEELAASRDAEDGESPVGKKGKGK